MTDTKIRFAADILRRLGEELNPSVDKGILELVKNSYDADARNCTVELMNVDVPGGTICVRDDGIGMGVEGIKEGWLVLGRSRKSQDMRTALGRIPAGSKGLGRLAALRMGAQALLTTRPSTEFNSEYNLLIDWDEYKDVDLVEDVILTIDEAKRSPGVKSGSEVRIEKLHSRISEREVRRLAREILLLAGPFGDDASGFKPVLVAPEFKDLEILIRCKYFADADLHLTANVNAQGIAHAVIVDWRGTKLFSATHAELKGTQSDDPYRCPEVIFELWTFVLKKQSFSSKTIKLSEIKNWLKEFGGVHIYQNGLRVTPYGDPGNDWLEMNLSRVKSPEERPSTNNSIGRVVVMDTNQLLDQKTDRSGFMETEVFMEIKSFAKDALEWMARRRLEEAEKRRVKARTEAPSKSEQSKNQLDATIEKLPIIHKKSVEKAVAVAWQAVGREILQYQEEIQLYRTLSTAGITSATFAHESSGNPIKVISQSLGAIERRGKLLLGKDYDSELAKPVDGISRATKSLAVLGNATLKLLDHEKRSLTQIDAHQVIRNVLSTFEPFLYGRGVKIEPKFCKATPFLRSSEAALESVITNLLNNSVAAFERVHTTKRLIRVKTELLNSSLMIRVADNGPGIKGIQKDEIWLPGRTTRKNGTGLGLTIVRDTIKDMGGEVDAIEHCDLGGAEIIVQIPILKE